MNRYAPTDTTNSFYQGARFLTAASQLDQAPPDQGSEVAFIGRSNAGKSSAINAICHQGSLARTSKTPGRTQQLIFFALDAERRLVDLPGYGYARVAIDIKAEWQGLMSHYLERRRALTGLVILMDCRHPLTVFDRELLAWGDRRGLPRLLLLTKADKLRRGPAAAVRSEVQKGVRDHAGPIQVELFSAHARVGIGPVQAWLDERLGVPRAG
ncbi:ribosome biogenesis GTP-binding protein YihA/YsxC [Thioalkalicoccus limnaeus]|uniref:Probable GTP-binding protein EngB n=1 Tax=Thioalkalicoccus limnaeus TaxID=120681 RepID=A0ABV4BA49_9GAMM